MISFRSVLNIEFQNQTEDPVFLLLGFTDDPRKQLLIYGLFLALYLITVVGNLLIILAVTFDSHLHTPMYFFLSNLSLTDICISTSTIPKMLVNIQSLDCSISYISCLIQTTSVQVFLGLENFILGVMAYDRYVAICHPLRYTVIMNPQLCGLLLVLSLLLSIVDALIHSLLMLRLSFCSDLEIPQFFCELAQIIKLACSDTSINNLMIYVTAVIFAGIPVTGIMCSYIEIISSVLRIHSAEGKMKAFSTCGSHLSVVSLFYGSAFGVYISSTIIESSRMISVATVMYIVIPQMMNPFIYSLSNRDMKSSLRKIIDKIFNFL